MFKGFGRFLRQYKATICPENGPYLLWTVVEVSAQHGQILEPLVFMVFGNYVFKIYLSNIKPFADDNFLFTAGESTDDSGTNMSNR